MKRFMTFMGSTYYASGGANDFLDSFNTADEAILAGKKACSKDNLIIKNNWWHVYDTEENKIIYPDGTDRSLVTLNVDS